MMRYDYLPVETVIQGQWVAALAEQLRERQWQRVMVISNRSVKRTGELQKLLANLGDVSVVQANAIAAHTPRQQILTALDLAWQERVDGLVAVGGGSVIDAAKVVQFALNLNIRDEATLLRHARFADGTRGELVPTGKKPAEPIGRRVRTIAVPTTLSGAEFSHNAGVLDPQRQLKEGYRDWDLCPQVIVYDPALGLHTPPWLWLSTAIRSLDHAIEGYCAPEVHPYLEGQFLHAMRLLSQSLPQVVADPQNLAARALNQQAVWAACSGLGRVSHGASHGIGYSLGSLCGLPHGYTSCVMLPAVLDWNAANNADRQVAIAQALGRPGVSAGQAVRQLVTELGLPASLQQAGVPREKLDAIADAAARHPVVRSNPRPINGPQDVKEILELAWS